jgi:hypothetical protein
MLPYARMSASRVARGLVLLLLAVGLAVSFTYPIAFKLDRIGRLNTGDGQWSLWCVTWVAHALVTDPRDLYHTNIFYPHRNTLAYSEANIIPGLLGVPAYLATRSPYATNNSVVLMGFIFSFLTAYSLAHYLTRHVVASIFCGIAFAYCPFIFARTAHIQLLMTFGLPWSLHMMHRLIDRPNLWNSVALGLVLVVQALACAYYGIFAGLTVGLGIVFYAFTRRLWTSLAYWGWVAVAAIVAVGVVAPFFAPYVYVQNELGFARTIAEAYMFSADRGAWLASSAHAHRWLLALLRNWGGWREVLFPGFLTTALGLVGFWIGVRSARRAGDPAVSAMRETLCFYTLVGVIAFWTSLGPSAGLYTLLYHTIPVFSFLRAPARAGIMVSLALAVLASVALAWMLRSRPKRTVIAAGVVLSVALAAELANAPLRWFVEASPVHPAYRMLAKLPRGPVAEFPFFYERPDFPRHTRYMLASTFHWQPLVNGYSDYIPEDFRRLVRPVSSFPSRDAFDLLRERRTRYVLFHANHYDQRSLELLKQGLETYQAFLTPLYRDNEIWMYEIVGWP